MKVMSVSPLTLVVAGDFSVWGMLRDSDPIVKGVMGLLLLVSVLTWTIWLAKSVELRRAQRALEHDVRVMSHALSVSGVSGVLSPAVQAMLEGIRSEMARAGDLRSSVHSDGLKERASLFLQSLEMELAQRMLRGTHAIASIGATAPFVGLFGTVWGIMNSFTGIARAHATNLTVVAPGIAEALLTTAMGLVVAVPAVLIYNSLTRAQARYRALLAKATNATACVLSLELERLGSSAGAGERVLPRREAIHGA